MRVPACSIAVVLASALAMAAATPAVKKSSPTSVKSGSAKARPAKAASAKAAKASSVNPVSTKTGPAKSVSSKKAGSRTRGKTVVKAVPRRPAQQQPTSDRYRQIQQALSDKGYFSGEADGTWGASSQAALKRFQHDQNLDEDGKLDSLSLIALGLGPSRTASNVVRENIVREKPEPPATEPKP